MWLQVWHPLQYKILWLKKDMAVFFSTHVVVPAQGNLSCYHFLIREHNWCWNLAFEIIPYRIRSFWGPGGVSIFILYRISKFFGLSITDETLVVEMRLWCIKIFIVLVLHPNSLNRTLSSENVGFGSKILILKSFPWVYSSLLLVKLIFFYIAIVITMTSYLICIY